MNSIYIICCVVSITGSAEIKRNFANGYNYPIPPESQDLPNPGATGSFLDDIPAVIATYLPPSIDAPEFDADPSLFDPIRPDVPLVPFDPLYHSAKTPNSNQIQLRVLNMSCMNTKSNRFYKTAVSSSRLLDVAPVIEGARGDCLHVSGNTFLVDVDGEKITQCGVSYCSDGNLCMQLRIPTVQGLKLPEDATLTLQCRPQDVVATHVKQLQFKGRNVQGRSLGTVASGGLQRPFETRVTLFRRSPGSNSFTQAVTQGSAVQLGEDLLLHAAVKDGDGWRYSRMGTVTMQRISPPRDSSISSKSARDSVTLVDSSGCRIPSMETVCPEQPRQLNSLVTTFPFRAFMFQGAGNGDEMVLTVKLQGCFNYEDCYQVSSCEGKLHGRTRARRELENGTKGDNITDWQSHLEFRVILPVSNGTSPDFISHNPFVNPIIVFCWVGLFIIAVILVIFTLFRYCYY